MQTEHVGVFSGGSPETSLLLKGMAFFSSYKYLLLEDTTNGEKRYVTGVFQTGPPCVPDPPINLEVVPGTIKGGSVQIRWNPPDQLGGTPLYNYVANAFTNDITVGVVEPPDERPYFDKCNSPPSENVVCEVGWLDANTQYWVRVFALNAMSGCNANAALGSSAVVAFTTGAGAKPGLVKFL